MTVSNFVDLAKQGFYNGLHFHEVMAHTLITFGCPLTRDPANRSGGFGHPPKGSSFKHLLTQEIVFRPEGKISDEFVSKDPNERGTLTMTHSDKPNSAGSVFYMHVDDNRWLDWFEPGCEDPHYVFGKIIDGIEIAEAISCVPTESTSDWPLQPVSVEEVLIFH